MPRQHFRFPPCGSRSRFQRVRFVWFGLVWFRLVPFCLIYHVMSWYCTLTLYCCIITQTRKASRTFSQRTVQAKRQQVVPRSQALATPATATATAIQRTTTRTKHPRMMQTAKRRRNQPFQTLPLAKTPRRAITATAATHIQPSSWDSWQPWWPVDPFWIRLSTIRKKFPTRTFMPCWKMGK
jgi:hypothetical protein